MRGQRGWEGSECKTGLNVDEEGTREPMRAPLGACLTGEPKREGVRGKASGLDVPFCGLGETAPEGTRDNVLV